MISTSEVGTSEAETKILLELQRRKLNIGLKYQFPIRLNEEKYGIPFTIADFYYPCINLAIFLDGEPHEKRARFQKDEKIDEALKEKGIRVLRFSYETPISDTCVKEIVDTIEKILDKSLIYYILRNSKNS